ncbi:hypothetical protein K2173_009936 [Erythroxylum novogranatense]|uniref:Reverse transcriptase Ty1/copia-type domain-containing protein n=1 Tax=Erythroxylum novogranatense TaxID=1862640 RepID=A0AAV8SZC6_9ROSI|nr:hypothetical protein K2173_009936 [Erythroxylum novogranatense]
MNEEIEALEMNKTWDITDLPEGKRPIGCKWIFKVKLKENGKVVTIKKKFAIVASNSWNLHQLDINNAFFHGYLVEEVFMVLPEGYNKAKPTQVCKLRKSLYGLKQASRQ